MDQNERSEPDPSITTPQRGGEELTPPPGADDAPRYDRMTPSPGISLGPEDLVRVREQAAGHTAADSGSVPAVVTIVLSDIVSPAAVVEILGALNRLHRTLAGQDLRDPNIRIGPATAERAPRQERR